MATDWSVFLAVNIAQSPVTECIIDVHRDPELYVYLKNQYETTARQPSRWVILMCFREITESCATTFATYWRLKTRGVSRYIAKGFYLAQHQPSLTLEITPYLLAEHRRQIEPLFNGNTPRSLTELLLLLPVTVHKAHDMADIVRMADIHHNHLTELSLSTLIDMVHQVINVASNGV